MQTLVGTDILTAKQFLSKGELVAVPTETVYGLAGNALNENAVLEIFKAKNRPHFDPLIVHVADVTQIEKFVQNIPPIAAKAIELFMPGPLTLLLPKQSIIPDLVTSGLDTVAIRVPNHPLLLELLRTLDFPLAAPSANPFGYISPTNAKHVLNQLGGKIPYILDGGATTVGVESTILGFPGNQPTVYRLGGLPIEEIEKKLGTVHLAISSSEHPAAPGLLKSHYAPRKPLYILPIKKIDANLLAGEQAAFIGFDQAIDGYDLSMQQVLSPKGDLNEAARNLFAAMRTLDDSTAKAIYTCTFPETGLGRAINDRLKRAASH